MPKKRWNNSRVHKKYLAKLFMLKLPSHSVCNLTCSRSYDQTLFILKRSQSTQCSRRRSGSGHRTCHGKRIWRREQAHTQILTIHLTKRTCSSDFLCALCKQSTILHGRWKLKLAYNHSSLILVVPKYQRGFCTKFSQLGISCYFAVSLSLISELD